MAVSTSPPHPFVELIVSTCPEVRDRSLFVLCQDLADDAILAGCEALEGFWQDTPNLYERVRALTFLSALHRYVLPARGLTERFGRIPAEAHGALMRRRFREAIRAFREAEGDARRNDTLASGLSRSYARQGLQYLADQVRQSVRSVPGNQWMFRMGHADDYPLRLRPELRPADGAETPVLRESTAVRMDLSHSSWSDIFFLAMDRPEFARVLNVSINLALHGSGERPKPPVEAYFRLIDRPVIRLVSVDLGAETEVRSLGQLFDFGADYLGLLKAAVIASGLVPPGLEGAPIGLEQVLERFLGPGWGFELISNVNNIPKGSRLAVSTNLLASLIAVCMRVSGQAPLLEGPLDEPSRRLVAARAILGEWLGGSGGGWQDSGGVWPGIKLIEGCTAQEGDPEWGVSRGRLLPRHTVLDRSDVPATARQALEKSLVLVHGGMAQNVGPILEMVTEKYLLRAEAEWQARRASLAATSDILEALRAGDIRRLGALTTAHFFGPLQTIIPWANNAFTARLVESVREALGEAFWGFWMLGGMSGGGMGFIVEPSAREQSKDIIARLLLQTKERYQESLPFAMDPVIYDFSINENGSTADWVSSGGLPSAYYRLRLPGIVRKPAAQMRRDEADDLRAIARRFGQQALPQAADLSILTALLPEGDAGSKDDGGSVSLARLLEENGFDPAQHETIRGRLRAGKIGLAQNRLPPTTLIEDVSDADLRPPMSEAAAKRLGEAALAEGSVGVVTLAAGAGSRWTQGAGVVKALHPFAEFAGRHRNFLEVHLGKSRRRARAAGVRIPHFITVSHLTGEPIRRWLDRGDVIADESVCPVISRGCSIGLRFVPTERDLRFAWEEMPQEELDEQAQKMRASGRRALLEWARAAGEASDYRDNLPGQCLHPVGHWYEVPNMLLNGTLHRILQEQPSLRTLLIHNIDTLGADVDPVFLGYHLGGGSAATFEVISRRVEDHGGGLARVDGRVRLVEGLALPTEADEFKLRFYNTLSTWLDIDAYLDSLGLGRGSLGDEGAVRTAVREAAARMPTYLTIKDVKKRWGRGQEDVFPVMQFERLWGDISALPDFPVRFLQVSRWRGQQLKDPAQLDSWLRDGSHAYVESLADFA